MDRDPKSNGDEIEQDVNGMRHHSETGQRNHHHDSAEHGVDHAVEPELFRRNRELAIDRKDQERVQFSGAHQFRNVSDVDEKECLKKLRDDLVRADEQDDFPFRPVTDVIDRAKNDTEKNDLAEEPKDFYNHPEKEVRFETHLANERIAQHDK